MNALQHAHGVYPIAPTPFFDDGRIDYGVDRSADRLLPAHAARPASRCSGQLGEAPKLDARRKPRGGGTR